MHALRIRLACLAPLRYMLPACRLRTQPPALPSFHVTSLPLTHRPSLPVPRPYSRPPRTALPACAPLMTRTVPSHSMTGSPMMRGKGMLPILFHLGRLAVSCSRTTNRAISQSVEESWHRVGHGRPRLPTHLNNGAAAAAAATAAAAAPTSMTCAAAEARVLKFWGHCWLQGRGGGVSTGH